MREIRLEVAIQGLSVRGLARAAGLSLGVTTAALTGSSWPRWLTLESMARAVGKTLEIGSDEGVPAISALLAISLPNSAEGPVSHAKPRRKARSAMSRDERDLELLRKAFAPERNTGARAARTMSVRAHTYYDLAKAGRSPSSSTVLALAAVTERAVILADH